MYALSLYLWKSSVRNNLYLQSFQIPCVGTDHHVLLYIPSVYHGLRLLLMVRRPCSGDSGVLSLINSTCSTWFSAPSQHHWKDSDLRIRLIFYWFSQDTITKGHNLGSLRQQKYMILREGSLNSRCWQHMTLLEAVGRIAFLSSVPVSGSSGPSWFVAAKPQYLPPLSCGLWTFSLSVSSFKYTYQWIQDLPYSRMISSWDPLTWPHL